jgi:alpha-amylase/alpha-mannosidase (GH57 family)
LQSVFACNSKAKLPQNQGKTYAFESKKKLFDVLSILPKTYYSAIFLYIPIVLQLKLYVVLNRQVKTGALGQDLVDLEVDLVQDLAVHLIIMIIPKQKLHQMGLGKQW